MSDFATKLIMLAGILSLDIFLFIFLRKSLAQKANRLRSAITISFWAVSFLVLVCFWNLDWIFLNIPSYTVRKVIITAIGINFALKVVAAIYIILDGLMAGAVLLFAKTQKKASPSPNYQAKITMSRKRFLYKAAVMTASLPVAIKGFNIINRAYDYQVRKEKILLPNLPKAFHGITIGQISDIHTGSFNHKLAVQGGVDLLMQEKADLIFFTGDLVNQRSSEAKEYYNIFNKVSAPLGVYSILGNHDYGDYCSWNSVKAKQKNFSDMLDAHKALGWRLLRNENHLLREGGESLAILGVENWGIKRFSKYGRITDAYEGTEEAPVKLLLSHDPSHWEAEILDFQDIDITFSGHTHGFQFGIEMGDFRWSPSQYLYKQWAGMYQTAGQYIYVNRGYGFIGLPGRIGINPELTIFELHQG